MVSDRLSIWSLPAFAVALCNLLAAEGLILAGWTWPTQAVSAPGTLAAVHLLTIGWLLLLMLGALFQFVPVITSRALPSQPLVLAAAILIEAGLAAMICGFFAGGIRPTLALALPAGGGAVIVGVLAACWNIAVPLVRSRPLTLPGRMVLTGLAFLLLTVALGFTFALALSAPSLAACLGPLLAGVDLHVLAGLGGWFTLTAMGVSYKLLPMFMLSEEERGLIGASVHLLVAAGFAVSVLAGLAGLWVPAAPLRAMQRIADAWVGCGIALYLWDVIRIYRARKRAVIEAHNRAAVGAFGSLGLATAIFFGGLAGGRSGTLAPALVLLAVFGWLGGLGLTQLYKIVPFLTWLGRYGSRLGRGAVPRVQDLVRERRSYPWFWCYFVAVLLAAVCGLAGSAVGVRLCMGGVMLATLGLAAEYWRAWRGHYVPLARTASAVPAILTQRRS